MDKKKSGGVIAQIDASKSDLDKAIAKRKKALEAAQSDCNAAQRVFEKRVKDAEAEVEKAKAIYDGLIRELGSIKLYGNRIVVSGSSVIQLDESVETDISVAGAASGFKAGELFFSIVSNEGNSVVQLKAEQEREARQLAADIKTAIKTLSSREERSEQAREGAEEALAKVRLDTTELEEKRERYLEIEKDTSAVDSAKKRYDDLMASINPADIQKEKAEMQKRAVRAVAKPVSIVLGVCFLLIGFNELMFTKNGALMGTIFLLICDCLFVYAAIEIRNDHLAKTE